MFWIQYPINVFHNCTRRFSSLLTKFVKIFLSIVCSIFAISWWIFFPRQCMWFILVSTSFHVTAWKKVQAVKSSGRGGHLKSVQLEISCVLNVCCNKMRLMSEVCIFALSFLNIIRLNLFLLQHTWALCRMTETSVLIFIYYYSQFICDSSLMLLSCVYRFYLEQSI